MLEEKMDHKLSVIVPIYNVERYLERCLNSLLEQSRKIDEIILIDDGSTDNSGNIADRYALQNNNILIVHQENGGLSCARNTGLDTATGDYIGFIDSDDYIESDMFAILINNLEEEDADISMCGYWIEQEDGTRFSPYPQYMKETWVKERALIELNSFRYANMYMCTAIYKRFLFEEEIYDRGKIRFPNGRINEDFYTKPQIIARAEKVAYTSDPLYHYIQRNGSLSRAAKSEAIDAALSQVEFFRSWFPGILFAGETALFFSYVSQYTDTLRGGKLKEQSDSIFSIQQQCKKYLRSVLKNNYIPRIKKYQAFCFCYALPVYKLIVSRSSDRYLIKHRQRTQIR